MATELNGCIFCHVEDQAVTEEHLDLLRDNITSNWKHCARRLGLTDVEIDSIEHDFARDGLKELVHQMLECWKMKEGSMGCTIGKLCRALEGRIKVDLIQKILETCANRNSPEMWSIDFFLGILATWMFWEMFSLLCIVLFKVYFCHQSSQALRSNKHSRLF